MSNKPSYFRHLARMRRKLASAILSENYQVISITDGALSLKTEIAERSDRVEIKVYANDLIKLTNVDNKSPSKNNILLLRNVNEVTACERRLYEQITEHGIINASVLSVFLIENEEVLSSSGVDLLTATVERLPSVTKQQLSSFSFIIAVNCRNKFPLAFRQSASNVKLVAVQTYDFDTPIDSEVAQNSDLFITNRYAEYDTFLKHLRNVHTYVNREEVFETLKSGIRSLLPTEFNVLLPAWNCDEVIEDFGSIDTSSVDIVLWLEGNEQHLPRMEGTFSEFIFSIVGLILRVAVTEEMWTRYSNLIKSIDMIDFRASFIIKAAEDGARFEIRYV